MCGKGETNNIIMSALHAVLHVYIVYVSVVVIVVVDGYFQLTVFDQVNVFSELDQKYDDLIVSLL